MISFYQSYAEWLHEVHSEILNDLESLPAEALDWVTGHEMNSVSVIIVHLTGAERFYIGDIIMGEPSNRNRDAEFQVKGMNKQDLALRLNETESYIRMALEKLNLEDMNQERLHPRTGNKITVASALLQVLQHSALHAGHIQITAQLWHQHVLGER
jgi:uncharacterized damage-inducible protein DinB